MSSVHEGVSCDGCMAPNFAGDRYKCLRCYDFDLCSRCYMEERKTTVTSENRSSRESNEEHSPLHPMQCIMTQQDFEVVYQGDQAHSWDRLRVVIFTCPVCGRQGFSRERLISHVIEEHSASPQSSTECEMACPICISTDFYRIGFGDYMPNHLTDMAVHMQEYHVQAQHTTAPSNSNNGTSSETPNTLSEYLRNRDLRRVTVNDASAIVYDSDTEESVIHGTNRTQRVEIPRLRRSRPTYRSVVETNQATEGDSPAQQPVGFSSTPAVIQPPPEFSSGRLSTIQPPFGLSSNFSVRPAIQPPSGLAPLQSDQGLGDGQTHGYPVNNSAPVSSIAIEASFSSYVSRMGVSSDFSPGSSGLIRTIQYPTTTYATPVVPNHSAQRNQRSFGENDYRTTSYAGRIVALERDQSRNEALFDVPTSLRRPDNSRASNATSGVSLVRYFVRSARSRDADAVLPDSETMEPPSLNVNSFGEGLVNDEGETQVVSLLGISSKTDEQMEEQTEEGGNTECKKSAKYCTLFTALAKPSYLPVLKVVRLYSNSGDRMGQLDMFTRNDGDNYASSDEIPPVRLVMRIGRPLRCTYMQRSRNVAQEQSYNVLDDDIDDWWSLQLSEHLHTEPSIANQQSMNVVYEGSGVLHLPADCSVISRNEVALNRAVEALTRRNAQNSPSLASHDEIGQTNNPAYLNGNVIPPPGLNSRHGQVLPNALGSTLFLGADSVAEAVAREVAAFSESSGFNIRQLQSLISPNDDISSNLHSLSNSHSNSRWPGPRSNNVPTFGAVNDTKTRKGLKQPVKGNEQRDEDCTDFVKNAFKAPEIRDLLGANCIGKKRYYKPYDLKTDKKQSIIVSWLEEQDALDFSVVISDSHLDNEIIELLNQIPEFANDELVMSGKTRGERFFDADYAFEETVFNSEKGSIEDMLNKKCESVDLKKPHGSFTVMGLFGSSVSEQNESEMVYWRDYRFLRNRREIFLFKRNVDTSVEYMLCPLDYRLVRQLVFGKLDVPVSFYSSEHYLPEIFMRILRTNLRIFYLSQETKEFLEENMEEVLPFLEGEGRVLWDTWVVKTEGSALKTPLEVSPKLWYLLDLASFFEPKKCARCTK